MQPRSKTNVWANEEAHLDSDAAPAVLPQEGVEVPAGESDDEYQVIPKKVKTAQPEPTAVVPAAEDTPMVDANNGQEPEAMVVEDSPDAATAEQGPLTDADWLRSRTNRVLDLVEDDEDDPPPGITRPSPPKPVNTSDKQVEQPVQTSNKDKAEEDVPAVLSEEDKIRQTGRLYLRNLSYEVSSSELREQFSKYGTLDEVRLISISLSTPML